MLIKRITNVVLVVSILVSFYYLYIMLVHLPTDGLELAELKIRSTVALGVTAIAAYIRLKL